MISARTKAAIAAAKRCGGNRGVTPTAKVHKGSEAANHARADARASVIAGSLRSIADGLNARKILKRGRETTVPQISRSRPARTL